MKPFSYKLVLKASLLALMLLFVLLVSLFAYVAGTTSGARWAVAISQQWVPALSLTINEGTLLRGLVVSNLHYQDATLELAIEELSVDLSTRDLVLPRFKLQQLHARGITLAITPQDPPTAEAQDPTSFQLPTWLPPIILADTRIEKIKLKLPQLDASMDLLTVAGRLEGGHLRIKMLALDGSEWQLVPSSEPVQPSEWPLAALPALEAPLPIELTQVLIQNTHLLQDKQAWTVNRLIFGLKWQGQGLDIPTFYLEAADYGHLTMTVGAQLLPPYHIEIDAQVQPANTLLPDIFNASPIEINSRGDLSELNIQVRQAKPQADLTGHINLTDPTLPFWLNLHADTQSLSQLVSLPDEARLQLGQLQGQVQGTTEQQRLQLSLAFSGFGLGNDQEPANLGLSAFHEGSALKVDDLQLSDKVSGSALRAQGQLAYADGLQWQLNSQIASMRVDTPLSPFKGHFSGQFAHQGHWEDKGYALVLENLQLDGEIENTPLRVMASGQLDMFEQMQIHGLQADIQALDSTLKVSGQLDKQWAIAGTFKSDRLNRLHADTRGKVQANINLSGPLEDPLLKLNGKFERARFGIQDFSDVTFSGSYQLAKNHALELAVNAPQIILNENQLFAADLSLNGDASKHTLTLETKGDVEAQLNISGGMDSTLSDWNGTLNRGQLALFNEKWGLSEPVPMHFGANTVKVGGHCWEGKHSELCLADTNWQEAKQLQINAKLDAGAWFSPRLQEQQLEAKAELEASISFADAFKLDVMANLEQGKISQQFQQEFLPLLSWQQGSLSVQMQEDNIHLNGQLQDKALKPLLDLSATLQGKEQQLSGRLAMAPLPLAGFRALIPQVSRLSGNLQAGIALSGTLDAPAISGDLSLSEGSFAVTATQTRVDKAELDLQFDGNTVRFDGAFNMGEGQSLVRGDASWTGTDDKWQEALKLNAKISGHALKIDVEPELQAWVSPDLTVVFDNILQVDGRINIERGQLALQELPQSAVAVSPDMRIVGDQTQQQDDLPPTNLSLQVEFINPFSVQGFGFNGKIDGALEVRQKSPSAPEVFGNLDIVEGLYKAYGQRLSVKDGRLQFVGQADNPVVQLRAIRPLKGTDVEAGITVNGTVDALQVELYSKPVMDQQAILSYVMRGKAPGGESTDSQSQALLMATSTGLEMTNASALTDTLNSIPLISDITLDTETDAVNGDTLATVSGYIGERIYIKYGVGILEPVSQVTVRFYLMNQLWLEAISGLERSMDIYYSFDVD
ncbi:translocation/assembly module TamB domain-containing protein [Aliiglaciecola sp. CAU 1673]|uniref:translocation/assembly module TamB domain-containing protein n=1 Tax=Aliiglaciecola sp. CAU 1673 TaxID=3032595 RepID=UPI0023D9BFCE|nr:translocation/assembly module TamB domain-containing protein [Aliiglaciecola sp. CAU 1673]MDF2179481.1 translocation/assembly module TamB domain-containing protein [Aliiglaciecola sp. CAU 1673]